MISKDKIPAQFIPLDPRFGSGPSLIDEQALSKLSTISKHFLGTSHRKEPVKNCIKDIQTGIRHFFKLPDDYTVALGNGGATGFFDMSLLGVTEKKSAHFVCGEFSSKWFESATRCPYIKAEKIEVAAGEGVDAYSVDGADTICLTLNETSTGVENTFLPDLGEDQVLVVDGTSGAGQIPVDITKIDILFFSPQKVWGSEGGIWVAIISPKAKERLLKKRDRYFPLIFDWKLCLDNAAKGQTYNTPALSSLYFLQQQVLKFNQIGSEKIYQDAANRKKEMYDWATQGKLTAPFVKNEKYRSSTVATINIDDSFKIDPLLKFFNEERLVYGIEAYRKLGLNQVRIAMFPNITSEDLGRLRGLLDFCFQSFA